MKRKLFYILFCLIGITDTFAQYISVDETYTAQQLVENVLFSNACTTVSNVTVSGGNFGTGEQSFGYFNANSSSFPFADGVILSTGKIANAVGPNTSLSDDDATGWNGDIDLNQALGISNSINATVLEFDFVASSSKISFDYIFASEEYHGTAPCQYSDGFAFLLREVGTSAYQNLALIPGTTIPVKVTTVRPAIPNACLPENEEYFDGYNGASSPINYNGQTVILNAQANVTPGVTYHIKLVIADEGNYRYDSAIFLLGGSFSFDLNLGDDRTFANENPVCPDEIFTIDATTMGATTYQWYKDGALLTGETNPILSFTPPHNVSLDGNYTAIVDQGLTCEKSGGIKLEFAEELETNITSFTKCDDDNVQNGITYFKSSDITTIKDNLFTNLPTGYIVELFDSPTSTIPIAIPFYNNTAYDDTIYAKITNSNCYSAIPIALHVNTFEEVFPDQTIGICNNTATTLEAPLGYDYLWSTSETTSSITVNTEGVYSVQIINTDECSTIQNFTVVNSEIAIIEDIVINDLTINNTAQILVSGSGNYEFSLDGINYQDNSLFSNLEEGDYQVYVRDKNGCGIATTDFFILSYPKYFTPNGDGINDYWNIKNLEKRNLSNSKIYIFDRYGKLIHQISSEKLGWNGSFNGQNLPATDYWFILELTNGKTVKGHFSLIR